LKEKAIYVLDECVSLQPPGAVTTARKYTGTCGRREKALINLAIITKKKSCAYACRGFSF